jgi:hypothetical protein
VDGDLQSLFGVELIANLSDHLYSNYNIKLEMIDMQLERDIKTIVMVSLGYCVIFSRQ